MPNEASLMQLISDNVTKVAVLEKIIDFLITKNQSTLITPSKDEIAAFIKKANEEISKDYPDGTRFV